MLLSEYFIRNRTEPMHVQISVALVVCGAIIAGWETLIAVSERRHGRAGGRVRVTQRPFSCFPPPCPQGDALGLVYTMLNNVLTAWSHSQSKSFADKFKCHGWVAGMRVSTSPQPELTPAPSCAPLPRPPSSASFGIVQYNAM